MPTKPLSPGSLLSIVALAAIAALCQPAQAQTDDTAPFYAGGSLGVAHVSNVYRQSNATNDDTVTSIGLLGGIDKRLGRQHVTLNGSLQQNRYSNIRDLDNRSHSLRGALNWETAGNLSGVLSAKSDRALADFNTSDIVPIFKKNIESSEEYQAVARAGMATHNSFEAGWTHRKREFTAEEYDRLAFRQNTGWVGVYATPGASLRLGLVARHTKGKNPRYPLPVFDPATSGLVFVRTVNDYTRSDVDFTTRWTTGGSSTLNARVSRSKTSNGLGALRDFSGTTGSVGWNWRPTGKLQVNLQYVRDTGQESLASTADLNRVYTSWQLGSNYALTGKISLSAKASSNSTRRSADASTVSGAALDDTKLYNVAARWSVSRGVSLSCQYDRASRKSNIALYAYNASSYGCTGQAIF